MNFFVCVLVYFPQNDSNLWACGLHGAIRQKDTDGHEKWRGQRMSLV